MTLIVCKNCGHRNYDAKMDGFCGNCGKYLGFYGEEVVEAEPEVAPTPEPQPEPEPAGHRSLIDRVKEAVGIDEGSAPAPGTREPASPAALGVGATAALPAATAAAPAGAGTTAATAAPTAGGVPSAGGAQLAGATSAPAVSGASAATVVSPPARPATAGAAQTPVTAPAVQPGQEEPRSRPPSAAEEPRSRPPEAATVRRPPVVRRQAPSRKPQEGDVFCGECGEVNEGVRHFCRRCGNSLDEAVRVRIPWYRRFLNVVLRRRAYKAGERKKTFSFSPFRLVWNLIRLALAAAVVVGALLFALVPSFRATVWDTVKPPFCQLHVICKLSDIGETGADSTSALAGHNANLLLDANLATYWAASLRDRSPMAHIQFDTFYDPTEFLITLGPAPTEPFKAQPRPAKIELFFSNSQTVDLTLADQPGLQHFKLSKIKHVNGVRVYVLTTYPALPGSAPNSSVVINEIEFQQLS